RGPRPPLPRPPGGGNTSGRRGAADGDRDGNRAETAGAGGQPQIGRLHDWGSQGIKPPAWLDTSSTAAIRIAASMSQGTKPPAWLDTTTSGVWWIVPYVVVGYNASCRA